VSANPELEEKRQQINRLIDEIAKLAEAQVGPTEFFSEYLQRLLLALAAPAGVIWSRTAQGNLQLIYQINFNEIGLDNIDGARACHDELLRFMVQQGRSMLEPPNSGPQVGQAAVAPANLTHYTLLLAPILVERQIAGVVEIWVDPSRNPEAWRGFMQFVEDMATYAAAYLRNNQLRQMMGQQQIWTQLESFAKTIHGSLKPRECGYLVVNEARRLLGVDRVSVAGRLGGYTQIEAISGADVIEKRSSLVQSMRALFDAVLVWNERLIYSGTRDESLPPKVLKALDDYLAESNSKLLILMPLRDERETDKERPCRAAMLVECFEPSFTADQLITKAEIIGKHTAPAMYNALEHARVPFRWALMPIANVRDVLRGQRLAWAAAITGGLILLALAAVFIQYPLRMNAKGKLVPKDRQTVYATTGGRIVQVRVEHGSRVDKGQELIDLHDFEMQKKIQTALNEKNFAAGAIERIRNHLSSGENLSPQDRNNLRLELNKAIYDAEKADAEYKLLLAMVGGDPTRTKITAPLSGTVVTFDLHELMNKEVRQGDKLLQIARLDGPWEIETHIPEAHVGHVREALAKFSPNPLEVDIQLSSQPGIRYKGTLARDGLGGEVETHNNEAVLTARVQIGEELARELKKLGGGAMPNETEVAIKIRCGNRAVGYVWFYQLWEFFFEHVIF
jgi:hypothetical protein